MTNTTITLALLIGLFFGIGSWLLRHRRERHGGLATACEARETCDSLLRLAAHLQQHRGLSSGWLAGNASFEPRMLAKRRDIETVLAELVPRIARESQQARPCLTSNELSLFRFRWHGLVDELTAGSVEQNIARHGHLIAAVLDWLAAMGEARIELTAPSRLPVGIVRNYAQRLPVLAECLGQARAIGSSVAAKHGCSAVARVRLMFLIARSESLLEQACASGNLGFAGSRAKSAVELMAQTIRESLLAPSGITLTADAYFTVATQAVDSVLEWAGHSGREIDGLLRAPAPSAGGAAAVAAAGGR
ncbi:MAG: nitrate- and nitrite sensing domain-containing protein [Rhodocyclales bacterium]|nr:nitrate- and nitrite sensing domain-containing protein [Rhodocyclales bacterium]